MNEALILYNQPLLDGENFVEIWGKHVHKLIKIHSPNLKFINLLAKTSQAPEFKKPDTHLRGFSTIPQHFISQRKIQFQREKNEM